VREGFEKASSTAGVAAMAAQEERAAIDQIRQRQRSAIQNSERSGAAGGFDLPCPGDLGVSARAYAAAAHSRAMGALSALQTLADSLAGFEGRKAIAHVSDGIPLVPGSSVYEYAISLCDGSGARSGLPDAFDVYAVDVDERSLLFDPNSARMDMQEFNLANELHRVASHANAHSVRMYTFDASGLGAAGTAAGAGMSRTQTEQAQFSERRNLQDPLIQLADETGGRALTDSNRFDEGLDRMLGDLGSYYSLGYRPRTLERNRALDVEVEVKGKGRRVIAPSTRRSKSQDERVVDRMLAAVFHGDVPNPLLAIAEARVEPGAGRTLVRIGVPMHRITLLPRGEHHEGSVTFFVSARADGRQGAQSVRRRTVAVRVASDRLTQALTETYTFGAAVEGDLTGQVLAVGVRDEHSGQASFLSTTVEGAPGR
jgi:VWFA-related protein